MTGRNWWRIAIGIAGVTAAVSAVVRFGLPRWLMADEHPVRNVMEGLSWPAGVFAFMLMVGPFIRRWLSPPRVEDPLDIRRATNRSNLLLGRALHLVDGRLPRVEQLGLLRLRVKRAIDTFSEDGSDLPPYVRRDIDEGLEWVIAEGGMVLLHGRAASGKSRTAAEALRRMRPQSPLLIPEDGAALRDLVAGGVELNGVAIWLDDLERYLTVGGLDLGLLQKLCPPDGVATNVVIVATMRNEELARYVHAANATIGERESIGIKQSAIDLLVQIQGRRRISVESTLSAQERGIAHKIAGRDGRVRRAIEAREGFAEYLAAGIAMMDRWSIGDDPMFFVGQSLISAAVDCRRAGFHKPVSTQLLEEIYGQYLPSGWRHRADLPPIVDALAWAHQPVLGASSCLQPYYDDAHLASDYLLDRAQSGSAPIGGSVEDGVWEALFSAVDPSDASEIAYAAFMAERLEVAEKFWRRSVDAGYSSDAFRLAYVLRELGKLEEAVAVASVSAREGDVEASLILGVALLSLNRLDEAEQALRAAVDAGQEIAIYSLAQVLNRLDRPAEAIGYFRRSVDKGDTEALYGLGLALRNLGRIKEAEQAFRAAIDAGHTTALAGLGLVLREAGRSDEAEPAMRAAIEAGHTFALIGLSVVLKDLGRPREAEEALRRAAELGHRVDT